MAKQQDDLDAQPQSAITIEHMEVVVELTDGREYRVSASRRTDNQVEPGLSAGQWFERQAAMQPYTVSYCVATAVCMLRVVGVVGVALYSLYPPFLHQSEAAALVLQLQKELFHLGRMTATKKAASDEELIHTTEDSEEDRESQVNNGTSSQGNVVARRPGVASVETIRQLSPRNALLRMLRRRWALNASSPKFLLKALARAGVALQLSCGAASSNVTATSGALAASGALAVNGSAGTATPGDGALSLSSASGGTSSGDTSALSLTAATGESPTPAKDGAEGPSEMVTDDNDDNFDYGDTGGFDGCCGGDDTWDFGSSTSPLYSPIRVEGEPSDAHDNDIELPEAHLECKVRPISIRARTPADADRQIFVVTFAKPVTDAFLAKQGFKSCTIVDMRRLAAVVIVGRHGETLCQCGLCSPEGDPARAGAGEARSDATVGSTDTTVKPCCRYLEAFHDLSPSQRQMVVQTPSLETTVSHAADVWSILRDGDVAIVQKSRNHNKCCFTCGRKNSCEHTRAIHEDEPTVPNRPSKSLISCFDASFGLHGDYYSEEGRHFLSWYVPPLFLDTFTRLGSSWSGRIGPKDRRKLDLHYGRAKLVEEAFTHNAATGEAMCLYSVDASCERSCLREAAVKLYVYLMSDLGAGVVELLYCRTCHSIVEKADEVFDIYVGKKCSLGPCQSKLFAYGVPMHAVRKLAFSRMKSATLEGLYEDFRHSIDECLYSGGPSDMATRLDTTRQQLVNGVVCKLLNAGWLALTPTRERMRRLIMIALSRYAAGC